MGAEKDLLLEKASFKVFIKCATLCLRAEFKTESMLIARINEREVMGDASETGILKFCEHIHPTIPFRGQYSKVVEVPFSSVTKYQLSIHREKSGYTLVMKGAPEVILDFCSSILDEEGFTREILPQDIIKIRRACSELGKNFLEPSLRCLHIKLPGFLGERVLAYADCSLRDAEFGANFEFDTEDYNFPTKDYRLGFRLGYVRLIDATRQRQFTDSWDSSAYSTHHERP